jgi:hypothetical protein
VKVYPSDRVKLIVKPDPMTLLGEKNFKLIKKISNYIIFGHLPKKAIMVLAII